MGGDEASTSSSVFVPFKAFPSWYQQACLLSNLHIGDAAKVIANSSPAPNGTMFWVVLPGLVVISGFQTTFHNSGG